MEPNPLPLRPEDRDAFKNIETPQDCADFVASVAYQHGKMLLTEIEREKNKQAGREQRN